MFYAFSTYKVNNYITCIKCFCFQDVGAISTQVSAGAQTELRHGGVTKYPASKSAFVMFIVSSPSHQQSMEERWGLWEHLHTTLRLFWFSLHVYYKCTSFERKEMDTYSRVMNILKMFFLSHYSLHGKRFLLF